MSTWPEIYSVCTRNRVPESEKLVENSIESVSSVVKYDLSGHESKIHNIATNNVTNSENLIESVKLTHRHVPSVELVNVKCYVEENYLTIHDLQNSTIKSSSRQRHLSTNLDVNYEKTLNIPSKPINLNNRKDTKSQIMPSKRSPNKKIKSKYKKNSPEKPEKLRQFLERMKSRNRSVQNKVQIKTKIGPKIQDIQESQDFPSKSNAVLIPKEQHEKVTSDDIMAVDNLKIDRSEEISESMCQNRAKIPIKKLPISPDLTLNVRRNPEKFSDLESFKTLSNNLVGSSNLYKVEIPSVDAPEGNKKRRYRIKKKEADLAKTSVKPITEYFPKKNDLNICENGKRKLSVENSKIFESNKKRKVWNRARD